MSTTQTAAHEGKSAAREMREALERDIAAAEKLRQEQNAELIRRVRAWDEEAARAVGVGLTWLVNIRAWMLRGELKFDENSSCVQMLARDTAFLEAVAKRFRDANSPSES